MKKVSSDPGLISANDPVGFSFTRARKQSSETRQNVKKTQVKKAKREVGSMIVVIIFVIAIIVTGGRGNRSSSPGT